MYRQPRGYRQPKKSSDGKWQHVQHSGIGTVATEVDGPWNIKVSHRQSGSSIRRDVFSVTLRCSQPTHEEFLTGFASKVAALEAAHRRVKMLNALFQRAAARRSASWKKNNS